MFDIDEGGEFNHAGLRFMRRMEVRIVASIFSRLAHAPILAG